MKPGDRLPNGQAAGPDAALQECLLAVKESFDAAPGRAGIACGFKNTGLGMGHHDIGRCVVRVAVDHVDLLSGAADMGQGVANVLTQIACQSLGLEPSRVRVVLPDSETTPDSGTTTASRQTLITGEACRRACVAAAAAAAGGLAAGARSRMRRLAGREFLGEYVAVTDPFETDSVEPVRHVAYSYACQVALLGPDRRIQEVVAAHDSGVVVNPLAFEGQVEGGVVMGLGYALTESLGLQDCTPTAKFSQLGLLRSTDVPAIRTLIVRKTGARERNRRRRVGRRVRRQGGSAKSRPSPRPPPLPAYFAMDGTLRTSLPLADTPYSRKRIRRPDQSEKGAHAQCARMRPRQESEQPGPGRRDCRKKHGSEYKTISSEEALRELGSGPEVLGEAEIVEKAEGILGRKRSCSRQEERRSSPVSVTVLGAHAVALCPIACQSHPM